VGSISQWMGRQWANSGCFGFWVAALLPISNEGGRSIEGGDTSNSRAVEMRHVELRVGILKSQLILMG
jgi:hypothetical protein